MDHFNYKDDSLYCEDVAISELAEIYGTPLYVYSRATLERHWHAFDQALTGRDHLVCYAVKAKAIVPPVRLLNPLSDANLELNGGMEFWGLTGGTIAFDYQRNIQKLGLGLDEDEAADIINTILNRFEHLA